MRQARDVGRRAAATSTDGRGSRVSRNVVASAAALIALIVYVPRVCRTLSVMGDSAVFVSAAVSFGVPQPSGYPLYTALAHAATFMPFGTLPFRVHLWSAVYILRFYFPDVANLAAELEARAKDMDSQKAAQYL